MVYYQMWFKDGFKALLCLLCPPNCAGPQSINLVAPCKFYSKDFFLDNYYLITRNRSQFTIQYETASGSMLISHYCNFQLCNEVKEKGFQRGRIYHSAKGGPKFEF